jgi:hypothetical protein
MEQPAEGQRRGSSYATVAETGGAADVQESAMLRRAVALQLERDFTESDKVCLAFEKEHPKSPNLAEAKLRHAENALLAAVAGKGSADDAAARLNRVIEAYPIAPPTSRGRWPR